MKILLCTALLCASLVSGFADAPAAPTEPRAPMRLWEGDAPFAKGKQPHVPQDRETFENLIEYGDVGLIGVSKIEFCYDVPDIGKEPLKKRIVQSHLLAQLIDLLTDAARALRFIRSNAEKWGIDPKRIGVIGSSAGGHLAATLLTRFDNGNPNAADPVDRVSSRPDFGILCYPVITMEKGVTHWGSRINLLGKDAAPELVKELSAELQVKPDTPPCFLWHTAADRGVLPENSIRFARALAAKKIPFDLHIYQNGGHGIGLRAKYPFQNAHPWSRDLVFWMKENKIIR